MSDREATKKDMEFAYNVGKTGSEFAIKAFIDDVRDKPFSPSWAICERNVLSGAVASAQEGRPGNMKFILSQLTHYPEAVVAQIACEKDSFYALGQALHAIDRGQRQFTLDAAMLRVGFNAQAIRNLVSLGANVHFEGESLLRRAADAGEDDTVKTLRSLGASFSTAKKYAATAEERAVLEVYESGRSPHKNNPDLAAALREIEALKARANGVGGPK